MTSSTLDERFNFPNLHFSPSPTKLAENTGRPIRWNKTQTDSSLSISLNVPSLNNTATDVHYEAIKVEILTDHLTMILSSLIDNYSDSVFNEDMKEELENIICLFVDDVFEILKSLLDFVDDDTAYRALEIIGSSTTVLKSKKSKFFSDLLLHHSPLVKLGAIDSLSWIKSVESLDVLNSLLKSESSSILKNALRRAIDRISSA